MTEAETIAFSVIGNLSNGGVLPESSTTCSTSGDEPQFKGNSIRNLALLDDTTHSQIFNSFLYNNAHSFWLNDRDGFNQSGYFWTGPDDTNNAARQSSAIMPVSALAAPSTALLPFAKDAGDQCHF